MKGDYVQVTYRTPVGVAVDKIVAEKDGASVHYKLPDRNSSFIIVEVENKAKMVISTSLFATSEVVAVREGHEQLARKRKAK